MHKLIFAIAFIVLVTLIGIVWYQETFRARPAPIASHPTPGPIVVQGIILCLPHKNTKGPQTLECAFGLKDGAGRYFALRDSDPQYRTISNVPMNVNVQVEGTFTPQGDLRYQSIGIIEVTRIVPVASPTIPGASGKSGIQGTVLLGPTCPVIKDPPEEECADRPYQTRLVVTTSDQARVITEFSSDNTGKFSVQVLPGEYAIRSAAAANVLPYCSSSDKITVKSNVYTETTIYCDTGIR